MGSCFTMSTVRSGRQPRCVKANSGRASAQQMAPLLARTPLPRQPCSQPSKMSAPRSVYYLQPLCSNVLLDLCVCEHGFRCVVRVTNSIEVWPVLRVEPKLARNVTRLQHQLWCAERCLPNKICSLILLLILYKSLNVHLGAVLLVCWFGGTAEPPHAAKSAKRAGAGACTSLEVGHDSALNARSRKVLWRHTARSDF